MVAVTGTNGKSSTVSFLRDIWTHSGHSARSLGTLGLRSTGTLHTNVEASFTTFDTKSAHLIISSLAPSVTHLALEASSHGLHQGRLDGFEFDAAVFTNLTQDHLDYHKSMDAYFAAKLLLFTERLKAGGSAIVNTDDEYGVYIASEMRRRKTKLITFSPSGAPADLRVLWRGPTEQGQTLFFSVFGPTHQVLAPVAGSFQAGNILAAVGAAIATGVEPRAAIASISRLESVPGRLERAAVLSNSASVYIDFAHTPDALQNVLLSLRPHVRKGSRLHVVFGCGGDRDTSKRPLMGRIASDLADVVLVTDDNPRTESATEIRKAILAAAPAARDAGDRFTAIGIALSGLRNGDVLLIAGKGHEDYQILPLLDENEKLIRSSDGKVQTHKVPFSDSETVQRLASSLELLKGENGVPVAA
jgi:UDP-N-acetylmuramoyl-L-alanyl-D-glutamate--2,6-diaminopimelate ligase